MGVTALISTILGLLGGALPRLLGMIEARGNHKREIEFVKLQHECQLERIKLEADGKLREAETGIVAEEVRAMREHLTAIIEAQAKPTGIVWVDTFNAVLRPAATTLIILIFAIGAFAHLASCVSMYRAGIITDGQALAAAMFSGTVGVAVEGALGFLFGVRTSMLRR